MYTQAVTLARYKNKNLAASKPLGKVPAKEYLRTSPALYVCSRLQAKANGRTGTCRAAAGRTSPKRHCSA